MHLSFADESLRPLRNTEELLVRAFGSAWPSVARCLRILEAAETLADVATFAAVVVCQVLQTIEGVIEFVVEYGSARLWLRAQAPAAGAAIGWGDREGLALIQAVSIVSVTLTPAVVGR